jgi:hypothetical protein
MKDLSDHFWIEYVFNFENRESKKFKVLLDKKTLIAVSPEGSSDEEWAKLDFCKCKICPLDPKIVKNCPIAYNITGLAKEFSEIYSIEKVNTQVNAPERSYFKVDTVQQGLRSILGIYLATSGCPFMEVLKPMARFHLPFASMEETIYRHSCNFLLGEYLESMDTATPMDIRQKKFIKKLIKKYDNIDQVNNYMCKRIEMITEGDANKNALIILNVIGLMIKLEIEGNFKSLRYLFNSKEENQKK